MILVLENGMRAVACRIKVESVAAHACGKVADGDVFDLAMDGKHAERRVAIVCVNVLDKQIHDGAVLLSPVVAVKILIVGIQCDQIVIGALALSADVADHAAVAMTVDVYAVLTHGQMRGGKENILNEIILHTGETDVIGIRIVDVHIAKGQSFDALKAEGKPRAWACDPVGTGVVDIVAVNLAALKYDVLVAALKIRVGDDGAVTCTVKAMIRSIDHRVFIQFNMAIGGDAQGLGDHIGAGREKDLFFVGKRLLNGRGAVKRAVADGTVFCNVGHDHSPFQEFLI